MYEYNKSWGAGTISFKRVCAWDNCDKEFDVKSLFSREKYCDEHKKEAQKSNVLKAKRRYDSKNRELLNKKRRERYWNNREQELKRRKERYAKNPEIFRERQKKYYKKLIKQNPELSSTNRRFFGFIIRQNEYKTSKTGYDSWQTHHIFPVWLYPHFALEEWNGIPLSKEWHKDFHIKLGGFQKRNYSIDHAQNLFDFIEFKIKESNHDLCTLESFGVVI